MLQCRRYYTFIHSFSLPLSAYLSVHLDFSLRERRGIQINDVFRCSSPLEGDSETESDLDPLTTRNLLSIYCSQLWAYSKIPERSIAALFQAKYHFLIKINCISQARFARTFFASELQCCCFESVLMPESGLFFGGYGASTVLSGALPHYFFWSV